MARRRPTAETPDYLAAVRRMVRAAGRRVGESDTVDLAGLLEIRAELDEVIGAAVGELRRAGVTWQSIGEATGTSKQAAIGKWSRYQ